MSPDVSGERKYRRRRQRPRRWRMDGNGTRRESERGGESRGETKVVGKDESTRLA